MYAKWFSHTLRGSLPALLSGFFLVAGCGKQPSPPPALDPVAHQMLAAAEQALDDQDYDRALTLTDSAARRVPSAVEPEFLKGLIYSRMMRWEEADSVYQRVVERAPDFPGVWNNLGNNAVWQGAYQKALSYFYREVARKPAPIPWASIGRVYQELGVVDSAKYAFEQAITLDSSYIPAYLSYAKLMESGGEYERALAITERAAALAPGATDVAYMMGSLLARVGRDSEAVAYLKDVVKTWPWHTESHYKLGQTLQRLGRNEESRAVLAEAEELWKRQSDIATYQKGVAADPENPYRHAALATAFRMAGRYGEAIHAYKLALSFDPDNFEFQNNLASLYFLRKDTVAAIRTYQHILEQDPRMVEVWVNLGVLYALSGAEEDARKAWQHALVYRPNDPAALAYLAKLNAGG